MRHDRLPGDQLSLSVNVSEATPKPKVLLPQSPIASLRARVLVEQETFETEMTGSFQKELAVLLSVGMAAEPRNYVLCRASNNDSNADAWIDFQESQFSIAKAISLMKQEPPQKVESGLSFSGSAELGAFVEKRSTLKVLVPDALRIKLNDLPIAFECGGRVFFREDISRSEKGEELAGLSISGTCCSVVN